MIGSLTGQLLQSLAPFAGREDRPTLSGRTRQLLVLAVALAVVLLVLAGCELDE